MAQRYEGITITVNDDIGAFEDWMDDGSGIHGIDLQGTMERYAGAYCRALAEEFPGALAYLIWTNGGGRTTIQGHMDETNFISEDELELAKQDAFDAICPQGNPDTIIVWEEATA